MKAMIIALMVLSTVIGCSTTRHAPRPECQSAVAEPTELSSKTNSVHQQAQALIDAGKVDEAAKIYETFLRQFPNGPSKSEIDLYVEYAFKYAQMLQFIGKETDALEAFQSILQLETKEHAHRQVSAMTAELMLKIASSDVKHRQKYLDNISNISYKLLWKTDQWFSKGIVMRAHVKYLQGDSVGATKLLEDYRSQLDILSPLFEDPEVFGPFNLNAINPMAEAHYIMGLIMQKEAEKLLKSGEAKEKAKILLVGRTEEPQPTDGNPLVRPGALQHFVTVSTRYPRSIWAAEAQEYAEQIKVSLNEHFGVKVH
jgi:outer membrane protein assembly factor BamD (BamD/ComL family)